jgi:hypothetical protein
MAALYGLSIGQYVRVYKNDAANTGPDPAIPWKMVQIAGWHDGLLSSWGSTAPHHVIRLGPEGRKRLQGSTSPYDFNGSLSTQTLPTYPAPLWGSRDETEAVLVGDGQRFNLVLPPMAIASLGVNIDDQVRVWRDGNGNGLADDNGLTCGTLDTPPCFAVFNLAMSFESEAYDEQPARLGKDGRDRLGLDTGTHVIIDRSLPGTSIARVIGRLDTGPTSLLPLMADSPEGHRSVALPSPMREALGLALNADVKITRDFNANGVADVGESFSVYTIIADYDLPPDEPKYNRIRMASAARDHIEASPGDALVVERATFSFAQQRHLVATTNPNPAHPETGGYAWSWGGYGSPNGPISPLDNTKVVERKVLKIWHHRTGSNLTDHEKLMNATLNTKTKVDEHIVLPETVATELGVRKGQQIRIWVPVGTTTAEAQVANVHCHSNESTSIPYVIRTVAEIIDGIDAPYLGDGIPSPDDPDERIQSGVDRLFGHLAKFGRSAPATDANDIGEVILDKRVVCDETTTDAAHASTWTTARSNGQPFEDLRLPIGPSDFVVLAPHGGQIETGTDAQTHRLFNALSARGKNPTLWAFEGFWGGQVNGTTGESWSSSHVTSHEMDPTPEACILGGSEAGDAACEAFGRPNFASYPALSKINGRFFQKAMAFHGFGSNPPIIGRDPEVRWCQGDTETTPKVCIFIGGLDHLSNRTCMVHTLKWHFDAKIPGIDWHATSDGREIYATGVRFLNTEDAADSGTGEIRIRLAIDTDTLSGSEPTNVVNRLSYTPFQFGLSSEICSQALPSQLCLRLPITPYFSIWMLFGGYGAVQFEQSKRARDLYPSLIADAADLGFTFEGACIFPNLPL